MLLRYLLLGLIAAGSASFPARHRAVQSKHTRARHTSHLSHPSHLLPDTLPARDRIHQLIQQQERAGQQVSLAIVSLAGDTLIDSWHAIDPIVPASNLKILVTAAAWQQWDSALVTAIRKKLGRRAYQYASRVSHSSHPSRPTRRPQADTLNLTFPETDSCTGIPGYDLLCRIGKLSDNHVANALMDCLTQRLDRTRLDVVQDYLAHNRIWSGGLNCEDGSGRSPSDRTTALTLVQTLSRLWCVENRDAFVRCLSIAGADGTLRRHDMALGSRLRAKTGSISGVYSLSGYLARPDDTLAFSIILNRSFDKKSAFDFFAGVLGTL